LGRFIATDAYEGEANNPITWHGYGYARHNPFTYIDADGNIEMLANGAEFLKQSSDALQERTGQYGTGFVAAAGGLATGVARGVLGLGELALRTANLSANAASLALGSVGLNTQANVDAHHKEVAQTVATLKAVGSAVGSKEGRSKIYEGAKETFGNAVYGGDAAALSELGNVASGLVGGAGSVKGVASAAAGTRTAATVSGAGTSAAKAQTRVAKEAAEAAAAGGRNHEAVQVAKAAARSDDAGRGASGASAQAAQAAATEARTVNTASSAPALITQEGPTIATAGQASVQSSVKATTGQVEEVVGGARAKSDAPSGRLVSFDTDAILKWEQAKTVLRDGDRAVVNPQVVRELSESVGWTNDPTPYLRGLGIEVVPSTPGAALPAAVLRRQLDMIKPHRGNSGDALNVAESAAMGADIFVTADLKAAKALTGSTSGGRIVLPRTGGTSIVIQTIK
jgi:hypothetical protein